MNLHFKAVCRFACDCYQKTSSCNSLQMPRFKSLLSLIMSEMDLSHFLTAKSASPNVRPASGYQSHIPYNR